MSSLLKECPPRGGLFLDTLRGKASDRPPMWLMRQAGRYLPEYREIRAEAASFLDFCYTPERAAEATLQPIERFGFDAAILFSDILVVPDALGQTVRFAEGEGPRLEPVIASDDLSLLKPRIDLDHLAPVLQTVRLVRAALAEDKALIGFCGAPWTVATYMIAGKGTPDQKPARMFAPSSGTDDRRREGFTPRGTVARTPSSSSVRPSRYASRNATTDGNWLSGTRSGWVGSRNAPEPAGRPAPGRAPPWDDGEGMAA